MKQLFSFFLLLSSLSAFAIDPHETGGGNVCMIYPARVMVSLDEIKNTVRYSPEIRRIKGTPSNKLSYKIINQTLFADVLSSMAGLEALQIIKQVIPYNGKVGRILLDFTKTLRKTLVVYSTPTDVLEADEGRANQCMPGTESHVFLATRTGYILFYPPVWDKLSGRSQRYLILHEILRQFQIQFGDDEFSNEMVSRLTFILADKYQDKMKAIKFLAKYAP